MKIITLLRLALSVLCLGVGLVPAAHADLTTTQADAFLRDFNAIYNAAGASQLGGFYTEDATFTDPTFGLDLRGREEIGNLLTRVLAKYETLENEVLHRTLAGDDLIVEGMMVARLAGKPLRVRFVSIFHFRDGKISSQRDMFDVLHFYEQLGITPPQFRTKPPAAAVPGAAGN